MSWGLLTRILAQEHLQQESKLPRKVQSTEWEANFRLQSRNDMGIFLIDGLREGKECFRAFLSLPQLCSSRPSFNPMANFSLQFHPWGTHQGHENNNDHKLKKLSIVTQILSIDILGKYASYSIENMYTDVKNARILHPQFQTYQESSRPVLTPNWHKF